jgi:hypothetical protein
MTMTESAESDLTAFALEAATAEEVHVRHRASGHVLRFVLSASGAVEDLHRIDLDFSSRLDAETLIPAARHAAHKYLLSRKQCEATSVP